MMDSFIETKIKKNRDFWKKKYQLEKPNLFPGDFSVDIKQQTRYQHNAEDHMNDIEGPKDDCEFCQYEQCPQKWADNMFDVLMNGQNPDKSEKDIKTHIEKL